MKEACLVLLPILGPISPQAYSDQHYMSSSHSQRIIPACMLMSGLPLNHIKA